MQGRSQRIAGEALLPQSRREFVDAAGRMLTDSLQHIDQIVVGIDLVESAGDDQALHDPDLPGAQFGPAEQPVAPPHGNRRVILPMSVRRLRFSTAGIRCTADVFDDSTASAGQMAKWFM